MWKPPIKGKLTKEEIDSIKELQKSKGLTNSQVMWEMCKLIWQKDEFFFLENGFYKIEPKTGGEPIRYFPNNEQLYANNFKRVIFASRKLRRFIMSKARQIGFSTSELLFMLDRCINIPGSKCLIITDRNENSEKMFLKLKDIVSRLPKFFPVEIIKNNNSTLTFKNGSAIRIASAQQENPGRSDTFQIILLSEHAFWVNAGEKERAFMPAVSLTTDSYVMIESTPNGVGGEFYDKVIDAYSHQGEDDYIGYHLLFQPWFENKGYTLPLPEGVKFKYNKKYGDEEYYQKTFNLTDGQMNWRRHAIVHACNGDLNRFMKEYPATVMEGFTASGNGVFTQDKILYIEQNLCALPEYKMTITPGGDFIKTESGELSVWKEPQDGWERRYLVFADTGGLSEESDYSGAIVYDLVDKEVSAVLHGHWKPYEFSAMIVALAKRYKNAKLAVETNRWTSKETDFGCSTLEYVMRGPLKYSNLFKRLTAEDKLGAPKERIGFWTSQATKAKMIEALVKAVDQCQINKIKFNDLRILQEMRTYIHTKTKTGFSTYNAQDGCNDDLVMMIAGCLYLANSTLILSPKKLDNDKSKFDSLVDRIKNTKLSDWLSTGLPNAN